MISYWNCSWWNILRAFVVSSREFCLTWPVSIGWVSFNIPGISTRRCSISRKLFRPIKFYHQIRGVCVFPFLCLFFPKHEGNFFRYVIASSSVKYWLSIEFLWMPCAGIVWYDLGQCPPNSVKSSFMRPSWTFKHKYSKHEYDEF